MESPAGRSAWSRFKGRPRWQRRTVYVGAPLVAVMVLGGIGNAVAGDGATSAPNVPATAPAPVVPSTELPTTTVAPTTAAAPSTSTVAAPATSAVPATAPSTVPPTAPTTAAAPVPGSVRALDLLAGIAVENEHRGGYDRGAFDYPSDLDGDGCDTRAEILVRDSLARAQVAGGCHVAAGDWVSPYDGRAYADPSQLEIDHVVSLKEAWDSGAWAWDGARRSAFANDVTEHRTLRAVDAGSNRAKGDRDPSNWIPENPADVCSYLSDWVSIKARWGLSMDQSEAGRIRNLLGRQCPDQVVGPFAAVAPAAAPTTPEPVVAPAPAPAQGGSVSYANCTAARAAGVTPIHRGEPGYSGKLDRDGDGIACE
jgi:hypothetical protein